MRLNRYVLALAAGAALLGSSPGHAKPPICGNAVKKGDLCCTPKGVCLKSNGDGTYSAANNDSWGQDSCGCGSRKGPTKGKWRKGLD